MSNGGWTLISRFSNADGEYWMQNSGSWWYDRTTAYGSVTSTSNNYDMISPAFWLVQGNYIKVSRSDDSANTGLLETSSCTGGRTFRSFITSFGNFRYSTTWNSNACRQSCSINYLGGSYRSTQGFSQLHCWKNNIGGYNYLSFWCDWSSGDGAVMMIGGGGSSCSRADHGIGITEANEARFYTSYSHSDFGDESGHGTSRYSLNLWYKQYKIRGGLQLNFVNFSNLQFLQNLWNHQAALEMFCYLHHKRNKR